MADKTPITAQMIDEDIGRVQALREGLGSEPDTGNSVVGSQRDLESRLRPEQRNRLDLEFPQMVHYNWQGYNPIADKKYGKHFPFLFKVPKPFAVLTERLGDLSSYGIWRRHKVRWVDRLSNPDSKYKKPDPDDPKYKKPRGDEEYALQRARVLQTIENLRYQLVGPKYDPAPPERDDPKSESGIEGIMTSDQDSVVIDGITHKIEPKIPKEDPASKETDRLDKNKIAELLKGVLSTTYKVREAGLHTGWPSIIDRKILVDMRSRQYNPLYVDMYTSDGVIVGLDTRFSIKVRNNPHDIYNFAVGAGNIEEQLRSTIYGFITNYIKSHTFEELYSKKSQLDKDKNGLDVKGYDILGLIREQFKMYMLQWGFEFESAMIQDYIFHQKIEDAFIKQKEQEKLVAVGTYEGKREGDKRWEIGQREGDVIAYKGGKEAEAVLSKAIAYNKDGGSEVYRLDTARTVSGNVKDMTVVSSSSFVDDLTDGVIKVIKGTGKNNGQSKQPDAG